jgi:hypothetical protein
MTSPVVSAVKEFLCCGHDGRANNGRVLFTAVVSAVKEFYVAGTDGRANNNFIFFVQLLFINFFINQFYKMGSKI